MPQVLQLELMSILELNGTQYGQMIPGNFVTPGSYAESFTGGNITKSDYLNYATDILVDMYDNSAYPPGYAPGSWSTSVGTVSFNTLVYMYSQILTSFNNTNRTVLPDFVNLNPWANITSSNAKFFTNNQIINASATINSDVMTTHGLPSSITINGTSVSMARLLQLETTAVTDINGKFKLHNYVRKLWSSS